MIIRCDACGQKYSVADEKLRGRTARIRCRACGETLLVNGDEHDFAAQGDEPSMYGRTDETPYHDPYTDELPTQVPQSPYDRMEGVDEYGDPYPEQGYGGYGAEAAEGHSAYGYGGYDTDRVSDGYAQSAMRDSMEPERPSRAAARVKRDDARDRRDLFAYEDESAYGRSEIPPPSSAMNGTGARNENSVLFSLSSLSHEMKAAKKAKTEPPPPAPLTSDSGLIDLRAMMAEHKKNPYAQQLPSEPPPAVASDVAKPAPTGKRVVLVAVLGAAAALIAVFGLRAVVFPMMEDPEPHAAAAAPPVADAAPSVSGAAAAPPSASAPNANSPLASAMAGKAQDPADDDGAKKGRSHAKHHTKKAADKPAAGEKSAEKPAPPANDPCHCGGNLQCAMRCAT
jgi:predicted Zn finger-like uncharacterized protein